jgi:hypothetical protein
MLDCSKIDEIVSSLKPTYRSFRILNPNEVIAFSRRITQHLNLPDAPQYERPYPESEARALDAGLRKKRVKAANTYLTQAKEYLAMMNGEMERQKAHPLWFEYKKIEGEPSSLLEQYERRLSLKNIALKHLDSQEEEPNPEDWAMVRLVLLMIAGIHSLVSLGIVGTKEHYQGMTDELMVDLISGLDEVELKNTRGPLGSCFSNISKINSGNPLIDDGDTSPLEQEDRSGGNK